MREGMKLKEYIDDHHGLSLKELALKSDVSYQTLKGVARGMLLSLYPKARDVSNATRPHPGAPPLVTIEDLCESKD